MVSDNPIKNQHTTDKAKVNKVSGVVLIDKPKGLTSQQVVSKVKYLFKSPIHNSKKAGHTGTLDPMATGLLPICMGEATKFSHYQLDADKSYIATIKLGTQTDTGDAEGVVVARKEIPPFTQADLNDVAKRFQGDILQTPPMYSALKKDGKKLYEYARAGIEIEREPRPITINHLSLELGEQADELLLTVTCSKGTYVRVLGEDVATALNTLGHLTALRRTQVGHFDINNAISLEAFEALAFEARFAQLLPVDACIENLPILTVADSQRQRLQMGQRLNVKEDMTADLRDYMRNNSTANDIYDVRVMDTNQQFLGLGKLHISGRLQPKKMIQL